jgi:hypothetical protein
MSIRSLPAAPADERAATDGPTEAPAAPTADAAPDPMVSLLREDVSDEGLNAWASSAAARVLARFRQVHGAPHEEKRSGIFTAKSG